MVERERDGNVRTDEKKHKNIIRMNKEGNYITK